MNFRLIYRNPISGKLNFLYTHCVHCGKRVSLNRKNMGENRFGQKFYYCNDPSRHELKHKQLEEEHLE
ncbi:MAG: hypothetical protein ACFFCI_17845 [Promethearchaeota archaeon]